MLWHTIVCESILDALVLLQRNIPIRGNGETVRTDGLLSSNILNHNRDRILVTFPASSFRHRGNIDITHVF